MGDPLSITASLIAVLQGTSAAAAYLHGLRHTAKDIKSFVEELELLKNSFTSLRDYAGSNPDSIMLQTYDPRLRECLDDMKKIKAKLEPKSTFRKGMLRLRWPLKDGEYSKYLDNIERLKTDILLSMSVEQEYRAKVTATKVERIEKGVEKITIGREKDSTLQQNEKRMQVLIWLNPAAYDERHLEISNRRQKDTGEWLLKVAEVVDWVEGNSAFRLIWGYGIPGAGKTFLSSLMIDYLRGRAVAGSLNWGVAFMYFNHSEQNQQTPRFFLSSLVKQFACQLTDLPEQLNKLYDELDKEQTRPTFGQLYSLLLAITKPFTQAFIICDALDECDKVSQRTKLLPLFHQMDKDGMRLFLTSREYPDDIQRSLQSSEKIRLSAQNEDIRVYIEQKIAENARAESLVKQAKCKERIISELQACANGMFLLVHFHIRYLCEQTTPRQLLGALATLKDSSSGESAMDPTYNRAMKAIQSQPKGCVKLAVNILTWLVKSQRVLTVHELQQAVSVEQHHTKFDELALPSEKTMLDVCGSLVTIDQESNTVRLVHYTVKEYLVNNAIIPEDADFRLVMACATFLSYDDFSGSPAATTVLRKRARLKMYPFLGYLGNHFVFHLQQCDEALSVDLVLGFLKRMGNMLSYVEITKSPYPQSHSLLEDFTDICGRPSVNLAAYLGHTSAMRSLLKTAEDDPDRNTMLFLYPALAFAVSEGHCSMIEVLLENGAEIDDEMLHGAVVNGHVSAVRLLIAKGASVSTIDYEGNTPLYCAATSKNQELVRILLGEGADIDQDCARYTPIGKILEEYDFNAARILVENGDILSTNFHGETLLHVVAKYGYEEGVRILLEKGADISATNHGGQTPLHMATTSFSEEVVTTLLENGADILATDLDGRTSLHIALENGNNKVVNVLLEKGAVLAMDHNGQTLLHIAASYGYQDVVRFLFEKGANISTADLKGRTPLHEAVGLCDEEMVKFILEKGANISATDHQGRTPLHEAVALLDEVMVIILLEKGANILAADRKGRTPLHEAVAQLDEVMVIILLEKGADISATDHKGRTPLHTAVDRGAHEVVRMLLDKGADISAMNNEGKTPMRIAEETNPDIAKMFSAYLVRVRDRKMYRWYVESLSS